MLDVLFARAAAACVGARFRLQGRDPEIGLDCVGLILWCARQCELPVSHVPDYTLTSRAEAMEPHLLLAGFRQLTDLRELPGDVMIFQMPGGMSHVAVCSAQGMIHADMRFRRVVEHRVDACWRERLIALWRL